MAQANLRKHVYLPVPNPNDLPKETLSKPEMLEAILTNLDKSHQIVRNNILTAAKAKQQAQDKTSHLNNESTTTPANRTAAKDILLANLNAPAPAQDPCMPPSGAIPPPPSSILQEQPPAEIQLAQETFEQLEQYSRHARQTRHYYSEALGRMESSDPRRRRSSGTSIPAAAPSPALGLVTSGFSRSTTLTGYGSVNASPAERMRGGGGTGSANASPWGGGSGSANASPRDPRIRR